jgi:hypothetical protein
MGKRGGGWAELTMPQNGGHCQPLVYGSAPAVAAFELEVFEFMERFVKEEGVECDWYVLFFVC